MGRPRETPSAARARAAAREALRLHAEAEVEARPGVYRMLAADGAVLYVGKAKLLRARLQSHFRAKPRSKSALILRETRAIDWTYTPSEFAALREELRLIKLHRPPFNLQQKRDAAFYSFIHVTGGRAPRVEVARGATGDGTFYGPFIGPRLVERAARELTDALLLRDCSDKVRLHFAPPEALPDPTRDAAEGAVPPPMPAGLRPPDCIRHDVGKCLGPCIAACTHAEYDARVDDARAFLRGESDRPIRALGDQMHAAKRDLAFEHAALLRDRRSRLERLSDQLGKLRVQLEDLSFVYPVDGHGGDDRVYLIRRGTVRLELAKTADDSALGDAVSRVFAPDEPSRVTAHDVEEILLVSAWFRARPHELARARAYRIPQR
ncbi:MAG: GIY-YIG nuclease family protein [Polyangiaceae bacterium]